MKIISIGRNPYCNIVYSDNTVSRRHAVIQVYPLGSYMIVNYGQNGTMVNGLRITDNIPSPLKRGDSVLFGTTSYLDWSRIPDPLKPIRTALWVVLALILAGALTFGIVKLVDHFSVPAQQEQTGTTESEEEAKNKKEETSGEKADDDKDKTDDNTDIFKMGQGGNSGAGTQTTNNTNTTNQSQQSQQNHPNTNTVTNQDKKPEPVKTDETESDDDSGEFQRR